jgi:Holliday junction resolvase-like predicted endonuclease
MTDQELKDLVASLAKDQKRTEEQFAKTQAQMAETNAKLAKSDEKFNRLAEMYGGASNNQGKVAEEFFYNSLKHKPKLNGIEFDFIQKNITRSKGDIEEEYDIILVNGNVIYIVEVKYKLHIRDIERFLDRKLPNFIKLFPEYKDFRIHLAFASFSIEDELKQSAREKGITLLQRRGDVFETIAA